MFDHTKYIRNFVKSYELGFVDNNSHLKIAQSDKNYGVWVIIGIHKLTPSENVGKHNLFMEAVDKNGNRVPGISIKWGWEGQRESEKVNPIILDKPPTEPAGNIPIWGNQTIWAEINNASSDRVYNAHTRLADEGIGNTYGHYSFLVVWMYVDDRDVEPEPEPGDSERVKELELLLNEAQSAINDIAKIIDNYNRS